MNDPLRFPFRPQPTAPAGPGRPSAGGFPFDSPDAMGSDGMRSRELVDVETGEVLSAGPTLIEGTSHILNQLREAAQYLGVPLPCAPEEVRPAYQAKLWWLTDQVKRDARIAESIDELRRQAREARDLLMKLGQDPALDPLALSGARLQAYLVSVGAVVFILVCLLVAWFARPSGSAAPAPSEARGMASPSTSMAAPAAAPNAVRLWVRCHPWAECYLDGRRVGHAPSPQPILTTPGEHTIRLQPRYGPALVCSIVLAPDTGSVLIADLHTGKVSLETRDEVNRP